MSQVHLNSPMGILPADTANPVGPKQTSLARPTASDSATNTKLQKAAQDFEALMISTLWKSTRDENNDTGDDQDGANETLGDWGMSVAANSLAKSGGLGLAKIIVHSLSPKANLSPAE